MFVELGAVVSENKSPASSSHLPLCVCDAAGSCPTQNPSLSPGTSGINPQMFPFQHQPLLEAPCSSQASPREPIPGDGVMCPPSWKTPCGILTKPRLCQTFPSQPAPSLRVPPAAEAPCAVASLLEKGKQLQPCWDLKAFSGSRNPGCDNGTFGSSSG